MSDPIVAGIIANLYGDEYTGVAHHRFNNALRYRAEDHEMQRQLTPKYILEPLREVLRGIELDPCTEPDNPCGAAQFYCPPTNGFDEAWDADSIFVNPPYGKARERWAKKCVAVAAARRARVALLIPAHTDTRLFHYLASHSSHVLFLKGRLKFGVLRDNGRQRASSHPSCVFLWGVDHVEKLGKLGSIWRIR